MSKKPKFKPVITRVKLNPEQAVLTCTCSTSGVRVVIGSVHTMTYDNVCNAGRSVTNTHMYTHCCFSGGGLSYRGSSAASS